MPSDCGQCAAMVPSGWYVIFCAEAHAGTQVRAIPEDRIKVMRRMADPPLAQFNRDIAVALIGSSMPDYGFGRCDGRHKLSDDRQEIVVRARRMRESHAPVDQRRHPKNHGVLEG